MNTTNYYNPGAVTKVVFAFCISLIMILSSCKEDNEADGFFSLKDNPTKLEAAAAGSTETYTVQASGNWKVEPLRKEHWVKIDPMEGNGNGTFTITVNKNTDPEARNLTLFFTVDGKLQNSVLKVEQAAAAEGGEETGSYLKFDDDLTGLTIPEEGINNEYVVRSTGEWRIEIVEGGDWLNISPMEGRYDTGVTMSAGVNASVAQRTAKLIFYLDGNAVAGEFLVNQEGMEVILMEDFSWLTYGSEIFNATTGETRIGLWTTAEISKGWTSTINTTTDGGNYASIYARPGFVKLGRTNYGGDFISPKLSAVQGTKNLNVNFKAVRYATGDHYLLTVGVKGPGTVSVSQFNVMNVASPNSTLEGSRAAWQAPAATYSFVVTGATAETQVWFLGGAFDQRAGNWPATVNRIFIDDVVVSVKK